MKSGLSTSITETDRLVLREFTLNDDAFILQLLNTSTWIEFIGDRYIHNEFDARDYIFNRLLSSYSENGFGLYRVSMKSDDTPIGMCGLLKRNTLEDIDIGFALMPEFSGRGYAFEAAQAVLQFAKDQLKLKRVVAITTVINLRCIELLKKLGLQFEKTIAFPDEDEEMMLFGRELSEEA